MKGVIRGTSDKPVFLIDGKEVTKEEFDQVFKPQPLGDGAGLIGWHRPVVSDALAVHPDQVEEASEHAKKLGVPTEFQADGRPIFRSSKHFRSYARAHGFVHRGYA